MQKKLFSEISPTSYKLAVFYHIQKRKYMNLFSKEKFANSFSYNPLSIKVYNHSSLIRRQLGNVDMRLQENKAINLSKVVPKINGIIINPGETFSFFKLTGDFKKKQGFKEGLIIKAGKPDKDIGGGMCQFTNLIHWLVLHTPLTITEHHHHDGVDMFPDYGRMLPFGCGTSILYNYLDYRFKNNTTNTFQILVSITNTHLKGTILTNVLLKNSYKIIEKNSFFSKEDNIVYRNNSIYRRIIDKKTGNTVSEYLIKKNHAKVLYDTKDLDIKIIK